MERAVTDEQEAMVTGMTEREMVEVIAAMRKKADERDWIWEDIEELADQEYYTELDRARHKKKRQ